MDSFATIPKSNYPVEYGHIKAVRLTLLHLLQFVLGLIVLWIQFK